MRGSFPSHFISMLSAASVRGDSAASHLAPALLYAEATCFSLFFFLLARPAGAICAQPRGGESIRRVNHALYVRNSVVLLAVSQTSHDIASGEHFNSCRPQNVTHIQGVDLLLGGKMPRTGNILFILQMIKCINLYNIYPNFNKSTTLNVSNVSPSFAILNNFDLSSKRLFQS